MKPKLVLHICCAPDEAYVVDLLRESYDLHCFFCNPNIHPPEEYDLRLEEARKVARHYGVAFTGDSYDQDPWREAVSGLTHTPEGGERCRECFLLRLRRTASFCRSVEYPAFTTVMSISPHKRIAMLNETGAAAAEQYGLIYEPFDFKKKDGFKKSLVLSKKLGLYRQDYCGCVLSKRESEERKKGRG